MLKKIEYDKENRSALVQAGMYALPSARNQAVNPIDDIKRNAAMRGIDNYRRNNLSHDVNHDCSYLPSKPASRCNSRQQ